MKFSRSVYSLTAAATLAVAGLGASASAQAGDVYWQVGVSQPGVHVGVSNAPPVVHYPRPVVVYPQPQVIYVPQPNYTQAGWVYPGYRHGWDKRRGHPGHWNRGGYDDRNDDRDDHRGHKGHR